MKVERYGHVLVVGLGLLLGLAPVSSGVWYQVGLGRYLLQQGELPSTSVWNVLSPLAPWRPLSWVAAPALALAHQVGGPWGLRLIALGVTLVVGLLMVQLSHTLRSPTGWAYGVSLLCLATLMGSSMAGPMAWSLVLFLALQLSCLRARRQVGWVWVGVLLLWWWAQLGEGWRFGLVWWVLSSFAGGGRRRWRRVGLMLVGGLFLYPALALSPVGSLAWSGGGGTLPPWAGGEGAAPSLVSPEGLGLLGLASVWGLALVRRPSSRAPELVGVGAWLLVVALQSRQVIPLFVGAALPVLLRGMVRRGGHGRQDPAQLRWALQTGAILLAVGQVLMWRPLWSVELIDRVQVMGPVRVFALSEWGGALLALSPEVKLVVPPPDHPLSEAQHRDYVRLTRLQEGWRETLDRWQVKVVLLPTGEVMASRLEEELGWTSLAVGEDVVLLTAPPSVEPPANPGLTPPPPGG